MIRSAGVLMPVTALPSPWGVGTLGGAARGFVDFLVQAGQRYWQVLPLGPAGWGNSPYQALSAFGGSPYVIDLDDLCRAGLLEGEEYRGLDWGASPQRVDYARLCARRLEVLRRAVNRLWAAQGEELAGFCRREAGWLEDYALFMALKGARQGQAWWEWPEGLKYRAPRALEEARRALAGEIRFWKGTQYLFFRQWDALRAYARARGVGVIGDMPIYVAGDSADLWSHPEQFQLDDDLRPTRVAGCPPDGFLPAGQWWGNPLFRWDRMRTEGYRWWLERMTFQLRLYDVVRLDHFGDYDAYYAIPAGARTAEEGSWERGPGLRLFRRLERAMGGSRALAGRIIAEDLGFPTPSVRGLLARTGFPGMKVLELALDSRAGEGLELPQSYPVHCVAYVGTHDNDTALGWLATALPADRALARACLGLDQAENWGMMGAVWDSPACCAVVQMQDLLDLGSEGRINIPAAEEGNWQWRALPGFDSPALARRVRRRMARCGRLPPGE